jgi:hypothetical protein
MEFLVDLSNTIKTQDPNNEIGHYVMHTAILLRKGHELIDKGELILKSKNEDKLLDETMAIIIRVFGFDKYKGDKITKTEPGKFHLKMNNLNKEQVREKIIEEKGFLKGLLKGANLTDCIHSGTGYLLFKSLKDMKEKDNIVHQVVALFPEAHFYKGEEDKDVITSVFPHQLHDALSEIEPVLKKIKK